MNMLHTYAYITHIHLCTLTHTHTIYTHTHGLMTHILLYNIDT